METREAEGSLSIGKKRGFSCLLAARVLRMCTASDAPFSSVFNIFFSRSAKLGTGPKYDTDSCYSVVIYFGYELV